jgi:exopolysaccharide biosynthesis predicted pyruvyltransferase EpsI
MGEGKKIRLFDNIIFNLRVLHGRLFEWKENLKWRIKFWGYINLPIGNQWYLVGTPTHTNIGDCAIVIAEKNFINKYLGSKKYIKEITVEECRRAHNIVCKWINSHRHFFCRGEEIWETSGSKKNYLEETFL